jgi:hypothetical protein
MRSIWSRAEATERGRLFLAASVGELSVTEACAKLGITRQRFYELEDRAVAGFLRALEPKPAGRPARPADSAAPLMKKIEHLKKENQKLWLYVKVLRKLAGIEDRGEKRDRSAKADRRGGQTHDR